MLILLLLGWMLLGFVTIFIVLIIHLFRAEMKGYDALEWWKYRNEKTFSDDHLCFKFICGLFIWPARLGQFLAEIPELYETYELK